jgi:hypothetical protein
MKATLKTFVPLAALAAVAPFAFARAEDGPAPVTRVETIPAHRAWVTRDVVHPPVLGERCVPVFETVKVPIVETRAVPEHREIEEPVLSTRQVTDFTERRVPEYGPVDVPVYEKRERPVMLSLPNPFGCDDLCLHLWDKCEMVPVGARTETAVVGWRTERVPFERTETFVSGTQKRRVVVGERLETVTVGEREERRQTGWRNEPFEIRPARTESIRECVDRPAETVTVVVSGDPSAATPLPGTTRVVTQAELERGLAMAR